jgi:hypothetical protein
MFTNVFETYRKLIISSDLNMEISRNLDFRGLALENIDQKCDDFI